MFMNISQYSEISLIENSSKITKYYIQKLFNEIQLYFNFPIAHCASCTEYHHQRRQFLHLPTPKLSMRFLVTLHTCRCKRPCLTSESSTIACLPHSPIVWNAQKRTTKSDLTRTLRRRVTEIFDNGAGVDLQTFLKFICQIFETLQSGRPPSHVLRLGVDRVGNHPKM